MAGLKRTRGNMPKRSNLGGAPPRKVYSALEKIGNAHIREHRKTVSSWTGEAPTFVKSITTGKTWTLTVSMAGSEVGKQKYIWIDRGTDAYNIYPKKGKMLRFQSPYFPATEPGVIGSKKASRGDNWNARESVRHPGIEARRFTETINDNLAEHDARLIKEAGLKV